VFWSNRQIVFAKAVVAGGVLLSFSACGNNGTAPPGDRAAVDAAAPGDAAKPQPAVTAAIASSDAGSSASAASTTTGAATFSAAPPVPVPSAPVALTTAVPSMPLPPASASSAPNPWVEVESPLEGQTDCREQLTGTASSCSYRLDCDPDDLWVSCSLGEEDVLNCYCANETQLDSHAYTLLPGTELETACRASLALCNGDNAPQFKQLDCEGVTTAYPYSCMWDEVCTTTAELEQGIEAMKETVDYSTTCTGQAEGRSSCSCSDSNDYFAVMIADAQDACAAVVPMCRGEVTPEQDVKCSEPELHVDPYYCSYTQICGHRASLDETGEVYGLSGWTFRDSYCSWMEGNTFNCHCTLPAGTSLIGTFQGSADDACTATYDICNSALPPEAVDQLECGSPTANAIGGACTASAACRQGFGTAYGFLTVDAGLTSACEEDGNGGWSCVCNGGLEDTAPEAIVAPSAIRACTNAIDSCAARGSVHRDEAGYVAIEISEVGASADAGEPIDATVLQSE
jgi:hypothetical protein